MITSKKLYDILNESHKTNFVLKLCYTEDNNLYKSDEDVLTDLSRLRYIKSKYKNFKILFAFKSSQTFYNDEINYDYTVIYTSGNNNNLYCLSNDNILRYVLNDNNKHITCIPSYKQLSNLQINRLYKQKLTDSILNKLYDKLELYYQHEDTTDDESFLLKVLKFYLK